MKTRILMLLTVVALVLAMLAMSVAPAFADKGGVPNTNQPCGLGPGTVHPAIANPQGPGASEAALVHPSTANCTGVV